MTSHENQARAVDLLKRMREQSAEDGKRILIVRTRSALTGPFSSAWYGGTAGAAFGWLLLSLLRRSSEFSPSMAGQIFIFTSLAAVGLLLGVAASRARVHALSKRKPYLSRSTGSSRLSSRLRSRCLCPTSRQSRRRRKSPRGRLMNNKLPDAAVATPSDTNDQLASSGPIRRQPAPTDGSGPLVKGDSRSDELAPQASDKKIAREQSTTASTLASDTGGEGSPLLSHINAAAQIPINLARKVTKLREIEARSAFGSAVAMLISIGPAYQLVETGHPILASIVIGTLGVIGAITPLLIRSTPTRRRRIAEPVQRSTGKRFVPVPNEDVNDNAVVEAQSELESLEDARERKKRPR
jgi:hypothetical protein